MPLTVQQAAEAAREWAERYFVRSGATANMTAADILAAINAQADFIEAQAIVINNQFPEPFKSTATVAQKRVALALAALKLAGL